MKLVRYISILIGFVFGYLPIQAQTVIIADNAFRQCIQDSFPSALDASQRLILSQASSITKLECVNYGIVTVNELPYFTGLTELNLTKNPILTLPDISGLSATLTRMNIGETSIATLPDFGDFSNLQ
jgi:Leucine-rich repeat (LRR) protein